MSELGSISRVETALAAIKVPRWLSVGCLVLATAGNDGEASEGGYSNYIPGTYGDFAMAVAPSETWTLRNDTYYYDASASRSVRSGNLEFGTDL